MALIKKLMGLFKSDTTETEFKVKQSAKSVNYAQIEKDRQELEKKSKEKVPSKLPERVSRSYSVAKAAAKSGDYDAAFDAYRKTLKYALEEFCTLTGVSSKGKNLWEIIMLVCDQLNISWAQIQKFRELGNTVDCRKKYRDMSKKDRCLRIQGAMGEFLKLLEKGLGGKADGEIPVVKEKTARRVAASKAISKEKEDNLFSEMLPKQIKKTYSDANEFMCAKNYDEAFYEYKKVLKYALEEFCTLTGITSKGKSKRQLMIQVCDQLNIPWTQIQKFRELGSVVDCYREHSKMSNEERCLYIQGTMEEFLKLLEKGLGGKADGEIPVVKEKAARRAAVNKAALDEKAKKQKEILSFKARETVIMGEPFDIDKEYPKVKTYLDNAEKNYQGGNNSGALNETRKALETMVKALCRKLSVPYEDKEELGSMINKLDEAGTLSKGQKKVLSDAKWFGNMGSHDNDDKEVTESDVTKGFAEIKKVKAMFITFMTDERNIRNAPVFGTNEYYSPQRKYYGRWSGCFNYGSLMMIDDYVMLKEKAENGDVQAMLDIASGFLESSICWTDESLIYLKKYRDPLYHPDPCDARYYCWILLACWTSYNDWKAGKHLPLRYLANALLEGIKFIGMHRVYKANLTSRQIVNCHSDQFAQAGELFGLSTNYDSQQDCFIEMLTAMMKEYSGENLFAVVHKEKTVQDIERWRIFKKR